MNLDGINHGWRVEQLRPVGVLVHDALDARWLVTDGLLYVADKLAPTSPRDMDHASAITVEMVEGRVAYEDLLAAYAAHETEVRERERAERQATGAPSDLDRARRYVGRMDASTSGQAGAGALFRVAVVVARGFALDDSEALAVLAEFNQRAAPPWPHRELVRALRSARRTGRMDVGALLGAPRRRAA